MGIVILPAIPERIRNVMKVLIAHPGTQYSHHLAIQLHKAGLLYRFYTCLAISSESITGKILNKLPLILYNKLSNRFIEEVPPDKIKNFVSLEWHTLNTKPNTIQQDQKLYERNKKFQEQIPDADIKEVDVVIGFDTSSWILAERCKKLGVKFILDVSIGHPLSKEIIYKNLFSDYPKWKEQILPKEKIHIEEEAKEMLLADLIVVPGTFVKQTLLENAVPAQKIKVNQFGTITDQFRNDITNKQNAVHKIRFLFMGSFTARKGLPFLLDAWTQMDTSNAELVMAGYGEIPDGIIIPPNVINRGVVAKDERKELFYSCDVFVFPSFFEGLAQVQIEAMAAGLPVIGTKNSGAEDIVDNGINGMIIETGNKEQLKIAIRYFIENSSLIKTMGIAAQKKAEEFTWDNYGRRWELILNDLMKTN